MPFAARIQASKGRLRNHFGVVSVVIRNVSGTSTMTVSCRNLPPDASKLSEDGQMGNKQVTFEHSDPGRTFVPEAGMWATLDGETYRIAEVFAHNADSVIGYRLHLTGTE